MYVDPPLYDDPVVFTPRRRIGFVACCKGKLGHAAPAKELYTSTLFQLSRQWVEKRCDEWFILSAKYGVVRPDQVIEPYEASLALMDSEWRKSWVSRTWCQARPLIRTSDQVFVLAGRQYRRVFGTRPRLVSVYEVPLEGLGIGQQIVFLRGWLKQAK